MVNGKMLFTPGRIMTKAKGNVEVERLADCQWHHFWPDRYMKNKQNYNGSLCFEVSTPLHLRKGIGFDAEMDTFMCKQMEALGNGFITPGGFDAKGNLKTPEVARAAVTAWFRDPMKLNDQKRTEIIKKYYADIYSIEVPPTIKVDGLP